MCDLFYSELFPRLYCYFSGFYRIVVKISRPSRLPAGFEATYVHATHPPMFCRNAFQNALLLGLLQCRKLRRVAQPQKNYRCQHRKALRAKLRGREAAGRNAQSCRTTISFKLERAAKIGRHTPAPTHAARVGATEEARTCARRVAPAWWQS